jgi:hypothetical protein
MFTREFCVKHQACREAIEWAIGRGIMEAPMVETFRRGDLRHEWRLWALTRPGVAADNVLRWFACRCVRETPLTDGRTVWDLLDDPRSREAVETVERFADGTATSAELAVARDAAWAAREAAWGARAAAWDAARAAAWDAAWGAARDAAWAAAWDAARAAAWDAARGAARDAAWGAQSAMMLELAVNFEE